jgi:hypothetical protein
MKKGPAQRTPETETQRGLKYGPWEQIHLQNRVIGYKLTTNEDTNNY